MILFLIGLDVVLLAIGSYYLYQQNRIDIRGRYSSFQVFFAAILATWFLTTGINNLPYIIFIAAFITLVVMAGVSGLTPTRIITTGLFQRVIPYSRLKEVTLTPLNLPTGAQLVIAIFSLTPKRFVRLSFLMDLDELTATLKPRLPQNVAINIQRVQ